MGFFKKLKFWRKLTSKKTRPAEKRNGGQTSRTLKEQDALLSFDDSIVVQDTQLLDGSRLLEDQQVQEGPQGSTEDPRSCDAATMTVDPTTVEACVSTEDPRSCVAATMTVEPTTVEECVSTEDPRNCDAATMTVDPTTVELCVSTEHPRSCDAATMTVDPTTVEACVSTEDPRNCDVATMTVDPTTVEACVHRGSKRCDAATMTVDPTKVDAYVSTEDQRICDVSTMTVDPTVMCVAYTQTETGMDGGGAAAKEEYELQLWVKEMKIRELQEELAVSKRLLEDMMLNMFEGLRPTSGVKQTMKNTENQFHEDFMGPTSEVLEPPAQFEYGSGYGQMGYEQPTYQIQPTKEIMSDEYDTWQAATWVPIPQVENEFTNDVLGPTSEVVETPAQFEYDISYVQMGYEQPTFQIFPTGEIISYEYDTWAAATWVPIPQIENEFNEYILGPTSEVVETPAQFEYDISYVQLGYEEPTSQFFPTGEIMSNEYDTWRAATWVPMLDGKWI